tara:strand:+ start:485 stop:745 length:261 start_codon:yes stop_codon:yes gene_type:complete
MKRLISKPFFYLPYAQRSVYISLLIVVLATEPGLATSTDSTYCNTEQVQVADMSEVKKKKKKKGKKKVDKGKKKTKGFFSKLFGSK